MIKTAIIGYGGAGRAFHAPFLETVEGFKLVAVTTTNPESRLRAMAHHPGVAVEVDTEVVFQDPEVDLVVITTPNHLHAPMAERALRAGKHVVVDKPFTLSVSEADMLIALAEEQNRVLSVYQNRRWDGDFRTVQDMIRSGKLGKVVELESHFDRWRPQPKGGWREATGPGSGLLYDLGPHLIDQALLLFGMPEALTAFIQRQRPGAEADDYFDLHLRYEGLNVRLRAGVLVPHNRPRFTVHGMAGSYIKYGLDVQEAALKQERRPYEDGWGREEPAHYGRFYPAGTGEEAVIPTLEGDYGLFYKGVRDAIRTRAKPPVMAQEARAVMQVIELAQWSAEDGRTVFL